MAPKRKASRSLLAQLELPGMVPGLSVVHDQRKGKREGDGRGKRAARGPRGDTRGISRAGSSGLISEVAS